MEPESLEPSLAELLEEAADLLTEAEESPAQTDESGYAIGGGL